MGEVAVFWPPRVKQPGTALAIAAPQAARICGGGASFLTASLETRAILQGCTRLRGQEAKCTPPGFFSAVRPRPRDDVEDDIDGDSATMLRATMSTAYPDVVAKAAKEAGGEAPHCKRINKQPLGAHTVTTEGNEPQILGPIPYEFVAQTIFR